MQPITRKEMYLNRLAGEQAQAIPAEPITREEQYLGRLCGENNVIPEEPRTRKEIYLANLCGEDVTPPAEAITRIEQYMAFASGERETKPANPLTREEWYWDKYQGGEVPEEKTIAFTDIITVTDALARPAVDLQSEITATQNLNGYDYPWVGGAGKNKWDEQWEVGLISASDGQNTVSDQYSRTKNYIDVSSYDKIYFAIGTAIYLRRYDANKNYLSYAQINGSTSYTIPSDTAYLRFCWDGTTYANNLAVNYPNTETTYAPYENICPISGRTEVNVTRTGKNLVNIDDIEIGKAWNGAVTNARATIFFTIKPNTQYTFSINNIDNFEGVYWVEKTTKGDTTAQRLTGPLSLSYTVTTTANTNIGVIQFNKANISASDFDNIKIQIELGSTATAYEPYEGDTFNTELGRTVYGGTLDLTTGELTLTHAYVDLGDLTWTLLNANLFRTTLYSKKDGTTNFTTTCYRTVNKTFTELQNGETQSITLSEHGHPLRLIHVKDERATTAEEFTTLVTGQKMVFELATPQTISLTPTEVMMLENNNTIWADSGRVQLTYLSKAAQRVQSMNASLKANTLKITKAITGGVKA